MTQVRLKGTITGTRDGQPWPPAGSVVDLDAGEAASLIHSGMAVAEGGARSVEADPGIDPVTAEAIAAATTTRERQSTSKRAHEPLNMAVAADEQPTEDDNGPRVPEVNADESAKVEDPSVDTSSTDGITGETEPPHVDGEENPEAQRESANPTEERKAPAKKAPAKKAAASDKAAE